MSSRDDNGNDPDIAEKLRSNARAMERGGQSLVQLLHNADPVLLYRLADAADEIKRLGEEHRRDVYDVRLAIDRLRDRVLDLEVRNREDDAEKRGRLAADGDHRPQQSPPQLLDLIIKALTLLGVAAATAWGFVEVVLKSSG